jgi:hypothetical protein
MKSRRLKRKNKSKSRRRLQKGGREFKRLPSPPLPYEFIDLANKEKQTAIIHSHGCVSGFQFTVPDFISIITFGQLQRPSEEVVCTIPANIGIENNIVEIYNSGRSFFDDEGNETDVKKGFSATYNIEIRNHPGGSDMNDMSLGFTKECTGSMNCGINLVTSDPVKSFNLYNIDTIKSIELSKFIPNIFGKTTLAELHSIQTDSKFVIIINACRVFCKEVEAHPALAMISRQASGFPSIREKQSYRIGSEVYIHGLVNKPELNGLTGEIVKNINEEGRQGVQIGKNVIGLKLKNMKLLYGIINY